MAERLPATITGLAAGPLGLDTLVRPDAAAEALGLGSARTLADWRARGVGPRSTRLSRNIGRYRVRDLVDFIEAGLSPEGANR